MPALNKISAAALVAAAAFVALGCNSSPTPIPTPPADAVVITANQVAFQPGAIQVEADTPFTIWFQNLENVPHNVNVLDAAGASVAKGEVFTGPAAQPLEVPALDIEAAYRVICDVHPNMVAPVTVLPLE